MNKKYQYNDMNTYTKKTSIANSPIYKTNSTELKKKLINHVTKNGKKHQSEKVIHKSFKAVQKSQKRNHGKIIKLSLINTIPTFKLIKLTDKKRRKKSIKEIPALVSSYKSRVSLGLKNFIKTIANEHNAAFFEKFKNELLLGAFSETRTVTTKNNSQVKALTEKKYFRFYRW